MIAALGREVSSLGREVSSAGDPHELTLSGLDQGALEALRRQLDLADRLTVDLDATLLDHAPPVTIRLPELVAKQLRQVDVTAVDRRNGNLGLLRRAALADHAREVILAALDAVRAVCAVDDEARELELRLQRVAFRRLSLHDEPIPLRKQRIGDAHRLSELLLGRLTKADVVSTGRAHSVPVPAVEILDRERDLRFEPVCPHHLATHQEVVELVGPP